MKAVQTGQLQPMANDGQTNLHRVALYIALLLAMATGTAAQAEAYIPKPFPKPPRPLYIPVPIPKPDELFVYLHCMVVDAFPGERAIDYWAREGRDRSAPPLKDSGMRLRLLAGSETQDF